MDAETGMGVTLAEAYRVLEAHKPYICECACDECKKMCDRPCWGTPEEIRTAIDIIGPQHFMYDYWAGKFPDGENYNPPIICPALVGYEGGRAPFIPDGKCCLQYKDTGLCAIHQWKPFEGRVGDHNEIPKECGWLHAAVGRLWDTPEGRAVVAYWKTRMGK
jgi:hypothetical protein